MSREQVMKRIRNLASLKKPAQINLSSSYSDSDEYEEPIRMQRLRLPFSDSEDEVSPRYGGHRLPFRLNLSIDSDTSSSDSSSEDEIILPIRHRVPVRSHRESSSDSGSGSDSDMYFGDHMRNRRVYSGHMRRAASGLNRSRLDDSSSDSGSEFYRRKYYGVESKPKSSQRSSQEKLQPRRITERIAKRNAEISAQKSAVKRAMKRAEKREAKRAEKKSAEKGAVKSAEREQLNVELHREVLVRLEELVKAGDKDGIKRLTEQIKRSPSALEHVKQYPSMYKKALGNYYDKFEKYIQ